MTQRYRLGIDMGTNSLGWCAVELGKDGNPNGIRRAGVRVFTDGRDPQKGTSLAADRRLARQMRRRRDRFLARQDGLVSALIRHGLMPDDATTRKSLEQLDPYALRARGLDHPLTPHEFGRALFHLNQRRGFLSNRKTDRSSDKDKESETKGMKGAIHALDNRMNESGARTLGEYLHREHEVGRPVRARLRGEGAKATYDLYTSRAMYMAEFDALWKAQSQFNSGMTDAARDEVRRILFFQRPLKPVDPGRCTFEAGDDRAPLALPSSQTFRMLQELANLRIAGQDFSERALTKDERDRVFGALRVTKELPFDRIRRKLLKLDPLARFTHEDEKRKGLKGDQTGVRLAHKDRFGAAWWSLPLERQDAIVEVLLDEADDDKVVAIAMRDWGLDEAHAREVAECPLPSGYGRVGRTALAKLLPHMRANVVRYDQAAILAGYHHSDRRTGEVLEALPYYGYVLDRLAVGGTGDPAHPDQRRYGRIPNPTVHIGLNELRKLVNALIEHYGRPDGIVVELARELKQNKARKDEEQKKQAENQRLNDIRRRKLAEIGVADNGENRMRLRLWEELNFKEPHDRRCVYTGEKISIERLFSPDGQVEVEHVLPFRRTLDNSAANKTVSMRFANKAKGNQTPHEAFGASPTIGGWPYDWTAIQARANALPPNKRWRFGAEAMTRFAKDGDFIDRQLTDTQYLAKATRAYLAALYAGEESKVSVTPGRLTEMLRGKWGLNKLLSDHNLKNRSDHRHHAIDAFVIALSDRALLQRVASAADQERERLIDDMPEPWDGFRDDLRDRLGRMVVSLRPDHASSGRLHEETAYGILRRPEDWGGSTLVSRKALVTLNENEIERIRDKTLRARIQDHVAGAKAGADKWGAVPLKSALTAFASESGVSRVRLLKREDDFKRVVHGPHTKAYVPGSNHCIDIFEVPNGKWSGAAVSVFDANKPGHVPDWRTRFPDARFVMRVHKGDMLKLEHDGKERVMRVVRLEVAAGRFRLSEHRETGNLEQRHVEPDDPFRWLFLSFSQMKSKRARKVTVDVLGRVRDPGAPR